LHGEVDLLFGRGTRLVRVSDIEEIKQVIADVERGFNAKDAELMNRHMAPDAAVVSALGVRLVGLPEIMEVSEKGLAGPLAGQYARYEVRDVRFVRPDVALVHKEAFAVTADGSPIDLEHAMNALYVLVKEDGRWLIAARQNTLVPR
jgi:uncharacterized protein (TIGR02246 family)